MKNTQIITSKNTSVNTTRLPYIYSHINWKAIKNKWNKVVVVDYGCGREVKHIVDFLTPFDIDYIAFDPYWGPITDKADITALIDSYKRQNIMPVIICSNVLNVIPELDEMWRTKQYIQQFKVPYFIKIYEGNKSCKGGESKPHCWQWNQPTRYYMEGYKFELIRKQIITCSLYASFIK